MTPLKSLVPASIHLTFEDLGDRAKDAAKTPHVLLHVFLEDGATMIYADAYEAQIKEEGSLEPNLKRTRER